MRRPTEGVLGEAWGLYKAHWRHLLAVAAVVYVGIAVIGAAASAILEPVLAGFIAFVVSLLGYFLVQGALVKAVADIRDGRADLSVVDTLQAAWARIGPLATVSSLVVLALALAAVLLIGPGWGFAMTGSALALLTLPVGFVLFVVVALVLLTRWILIVPAVMLENAGARQAFRRSRDLVRGWGWRVCGVIVLTLLVLVGVGILLDIVVSPLADWLQGYASDIVGGTLTAPFIALAWTVLYYRLRDARVTAPVADAPS